MKPIEPVVQNIIVRVFEANLSIQFNRNCPHVYSLESSYFAKPSDLWADQSPGSDLPEQPEEATKPRISNGIGRSFIAQGDKNPTEVLALSNHSS